VRRSWFSFGSDGYSFSYTRARDFQCSGRQLRSDNANNAKSRIDKLGKAVQAEAGKPLLVWVTAFSDMAPGGCGRKPDPALPCGGNRYAGIPHALNSEAKPWIRERWDQIIPEAREIMMDEMRPILELPREDRKPSAPLLSLNRNEPADESATGSNPPPDRRSLPGGGPPEGSRGEGHVLWMAEREGLPGRAEQAAKPGGHRSLGPPQGGGYRGRGGSRRPDEMEELIERLARMEKIVSERKSYR